MKLYRIRDWEKFYEVSDSKKVAGPLQWVPVRTKTDGYGYLRITLEKNRTDLLAAWYLMLGIAAKQPRAERGKLSRNGVPLTPEDMELMTRFPAAIFAKALEFFTDTKQGWMYSEEIGIHPNPSESIRTAPDDIRNDSDEPGCHPNPSESSGSTVQDNTVQDKKEAASPVSLPFSSEAFGTAWALWEKHRREIRKPMTPTAASMALKALGSMGEARAIRCIEYTISKGWQGLREPDAQAPLASLLTPPRPAVNEPIGWKAWLNHNRPESVYAAGGDREAHEWSKLDRDVQLWIRSEMKKENVE